MEENYQPKVLVIDDQQKNIQVLIGLYQSKVVIQEQQETIVENQKFEFLFKTCGLVAHEIFRPLTIVSGNLYSVQQWLTKNSISIDDKIHQKVQAAMDASDRIVSGINRIRGFKVEDIEVHELSQINNLK